MMPAETFNLEGRRAIHELDTFSWHSLPGCGRRITAWKAVLRDRPSRRGFSLVEIIVVIGIIALLISFLLPVMRNVREDAKRITCANQMRQIGLAFQSYSQANDGWLPAWSGWHTYPHGSSVYDDPGIGWVEEMSADLSPTSPVYNCPSFPAKFYNYFIEAEWAGINGRHSIKWTDVKMSSRFIILGECTAPGLYPPPFGTSDNPTSDDDRDDYLSPALLFPDQGGFLMHRGGTNVLFDDLHVSAFTSYDPSLLTFHPHQMLSWEQVKEQGPDQPVKTPTVGG